jgi:hypothetical protein
MKRITPKHRIVKTGFCSSAKALRRAFEAKFADPRDTRSDRFVWDYWHIENQYSVLRTPARHFFPKAAFQALENELHRFGQTQLGCNGISDPWLSLYVDGSYQNLHADSPHGPWAYVYSLTPWKNRSFRGGETLVARDEILDFWPNFTRNRRNERGIEMDDLFDAIPAEFNQLTLFDPRLPHGVKEVRGPRDPLQGRLVIHGWFVEPRPFIEGGLAPKVSRSGKNAQNPVDTLLDEILMPISQELSALPSLQGTLSIRLHVSPQGKPGKQELLTHTLIDSTRPSDPAPALEALSIIAEGLSEARFPKARAPSRITIPFLFRN